MNEPLGSLRVLEAGPRTADGPRERLERLLLADDPLVQLVLHAEKLGRLLLGQAVDRDPGPGRQHLGDDFLVHDIEQIDAVGPQLGILHLFAVEALLLLLGQLLGLLEGTLLDGGFLVGPQPQDLLVQLLGAGRVWTCGGCAAGCRPRR